MGQEFSMHKAFAAHRNLIQLSLLKLVEANVRQAQHLRLSVILHLMHGGGVCVLTSPLASLPFHPTH